MRLLVTILSMLALSLSGAASSAGTSGLYGVVMRGPITPVCTVEQPCSAPAKNVTLIFSRSGTTVQAKTDLKGRYKLRLAAGLYTVRLPTRPRIGRGLEPTRVRVYLGRLARVDFSIDTGIR